MAAAAYDDMGRRLCKIIDPKLRVSGAKALFEKRLLGSSDSPLARGVYWGCVIDHDNLRLRWGGSYEALGRLL